MTEVVNAPAKTGKEDPLLKDLEAALDNIAAATEPSEQERIVKEESLKLLKGADGLKIIRQLHIDISKRILLTAPFVISVSGQLTRIMDTVKEPEVVKEHYTALVKAVSNARTALSNIEAKHKDLKSNNSEEAIALMLEVTHDYSELDLYITKELYVHNDALFKIVNEEYIPVIKDEVEENVQC